MIRPTTWITTATMSTAKASPAPTRATGTMTRVMCRMSCTALPLRAATGAQRGAGRGGPCRTDYWTNRLSTIGLISSFTFASTASLAFAWKAAVSTSTKVMPFDSRKARSSARLFSNRPRS